MMKRELLQVIYTTFANWSQDLSIVCARECCTCCSQNVTITAIEGEEILRYVMAQGLSSSFADKLAQHQQHSPATITTNEFAGACLEGQETEPCEHQSSAPCPFLDGQSCGIYPVRPLGCRLFVSTRKCSPTLPATVPDHYFEGATAVMQLVEHLGQKHYWGNMLDVLPALLDISEFREIADRLDRTVPIKARLQTRTAQPLPGFLLSEKGGPKVSTLLEAIFTAQVHGRLVEDILNGKYPTD